MPCLHPLPPFAPQFASNLHRMAAVKKAADASGRKICFIGMSLGFYLEAAHREGRAPFDPKDVISAADMEGYNPNELLIVTTGSQVGAGWLAGLGRWRGEVGWCGAGLEQAGQGRAGLWVGRWLVSRPEQGGVQPAEVEGADRLREAAVHGAG